MNKYSEKQVEKKLNDSAKSNYPFVLSGEKVPTVRLMGETMVDHVKIYAPLKIKGYRYAF